MELNVPVTDDLIKFDEDSPVKEIGKDKEVKIGAQNEPIQVSSQSNPNLIMDAPAPGTELQDPAVIIDGTGKVDSIVPALRKPNPQGNRDRNVVTGAGVHMDVHRTRGNMHNPNQGGNPITWEGYGEERPGTPQTTGEIGYPSTARRGRVPPGGFSSGLW